MEINSLDACSRGSGSDATRCPHSCTQQILVGTMDGRTAIVDKQAVTHVEHSSVEQSHSKPGSGRDQAGTNPGQCGAGISRDEDRFLALVAEKRTIGDGKVTGSVGIDMDSGAEVFEKGTLFDADSQIDRGIVRASDIETGTVIPIALGEDSA